MAKHSIDPLPKLAKIGMWMMAPPLALSLAIAIVATGGMAFGDFSLVERLAASAVFFLALSVPGFFVYLFGLFR